MWLIGAEVCLHAAPRVQLFAVRTIDGRIMRCGIISSCQSAATSEIIKRSWLESTHGSSAIASYTPLPLPFYLHDIISKRDNGIFIKAVKLES